jgi:hypothetical protein
MQYQNAKVASLKCNKHEGIPKPKKERGMQTIFVRLAKVGASL